MINCAAVGSFCVDADALLRAPLWPKADMTMWWDEAHALIGSPAIFEPFSQFQESTIVPPTRTGFTG
jgi:hypothetical protein